MEEEVNIYNLEVTMISSINNSQIKHLAKLMKSSKYRKEENSFVIEGQKLFEEAKEKDLISKVYVSETYLQTNHCNMEEHRKAGMEYDVVADTILKAVTDTITPQGIVAIVKMPKWDLQDLFNQRNGMLLFLENLRDPGNLGTIIRTAEGAGATGIIASKESVDLFNPKVVRSTMGSIFRIPVIYVDDIITCILNAKKHSIKVYATDLQGVYEYDKEIYPKKSAIIIGNEANGITKEVRNTADLLIKIPMCGNVESLNAGIAAGIVMYEIYRQKRNS